MNPNLRTLRVTSIGDTPEENAQVTLSAMSIKMTLAMDGTAQGRPAKVVTIFFLDDDQPIELTLSAFDLLQLESVVGAYSFGEE